MHKELEGQTHVCGPDETGIVIILGDEAQVDGG